VTWQENLDGIFGAGDISDSSSAGGCSAMVSPLERFLSCVYMKRHFQRIVQTGKSHHTHHFLLISELN